MPFALVALAERIQDGRHPSGREREPVPELRVVGPPPGEILLEGEDPGRSPRSVVLPERCARPRTFVVPTRFRGGIRFGVGRSRPGPIA